MIIKGVYLTEHSVYNSKKQHGLGSKTCWNKAGQTPQTVTASFNADVKATGNRRLLNFLISWTLISRRFAMYRLVVDAECIISMLFATTWWPHLRCDVGVEEGKYLTELSLCCSIVYHYNDAVVRAVLTGQLTVSGLILIDLAPYLSSISVSLVFVVLYTFLFFCYSVHSCFTFY